MAILPELGRRTLIMGVLNVTPDSFSDGGLYAGTDAAVAHALQMVAEGADILDIGGESTRPATFSDRSPLSPAEELQRVLPVIRRLAAEVPGIPISIDTYKSEVARAALDAGAAIVNDISGLTFDPKMATLAAKWAVPVIVMHILGRPRDIPAHPVYGDVVREVASFLQAQSDYARGEGVRDTQIWLDPGIGFGKTVQHNLELLRRLPELSALGCPLVVGASRKKFLGQILGEDNPADRLEGTAAAVALSIAGGADIVRVHDVRHMARVSKVSDAIVRGWNDS